MLLPWPGLLPITTLGHLVYQEEDGPYPPGLSSLRSITAAREKASTQTSLSFL